MTEREYRDLLDAFIVDLRATLDRVPMTFDRLDELIEEGRAGRRRAEYERTKR